MNMPLASGLFECLISEDGALTAGTPDSQLHREDGKSRNYQKHQI